MMTCKRCGEPENRQHGFCSVRCEDLWEVEQDLSEMKKRAEKAEKELVSLREQTRWRKIDEDNPETFPNVDGLYEVIVYGRYPIHEYYSTGYGWATGAKVTYWRPYGPPHEVAGFS